MSKYSFDLKHTNIIKGFLVLALVFHHVFNIDVYYLIDKEIGSSTPLLLTQIAGYGKVCVGGFCFLSAYGITKKLMKEDIGIGNIITSRLVKLYFAFWPIYIIGIIGTILFGDRVLSEIYISYSTGEFSWILPILDISGLSYFFNAPMLNTNWWYMSAAIYIIFLTPVFYSFYNKFKFVAVIVLCIVPYMINIHGLNLITTIVLGVFFAKEDIFIKIKEKINRKIYTRIISYLCILLSIYATYELTHVTSASHAMPLSTLACIFFCYIILSDIPVISHVLGFLGRHSANIYYFHAFIYLYWFYYTIYYSIENKVLIYCTVFTGSLLVSIMLELCKKLVRYKKLEQKIITRLSRCSNKERARS